MVMRQKDIAGLIAEGSQTYNYQVPSITHGKLVWFDVGTLFPRAKLWLPLDYLEIVNNTMCLLTVYINSPSELYTVPSNMIKKINKPFLRLGIKNEDVAASADAIVLHLRRLPKEATKVMQIE